MTICVGVALFKCFCSLPVFLLIQATKKEILINIGNGFSFILHIVNTTGKFVFEIRTPFILFQTITFIVPFFFLDSAMFNSVILFSFLSWEWKVDCFPRSMLRARLYFLITINATPILKDVTFHYSLIHL